MMEIDTLADVLGEFINSEDWEEARRTVEEHPNLLSDEAQSLLSGNIEDYRKMDRDDVADYLEEHRVVLQRCREVGVEKAFDEEEQRTEDRERQRIEELTKLRPADPTPPQAAVWQWLMTTDPDEVETTLSAHPELAADQAALDYIDALMQQAKDAGYLVALDYLSGHHELLRDIYELPPTMRALEAFMAAPTWSESRQILEKNPDLLSDEALQMVDNVIREAETAGDESTANALRTYRQVLQRAREEGIEKAILEAERAQG
jgi:hypothetical protein